MKRIATQRGFSLLELLVSLVVFSIGLLGIAGLQMLSKQLAFEGLQRTIASQVAYGLLEDMRTNGSGISVYVAANDLGGGSLNGLPVSTCNDTNAPCSPAQKAVHDLRFWEQVVDGNLETSNDVGTGGLVLPTLCIDGPAVGGPGIYRVTIVWRGTASITNASNNACGSNSGNYGANLEFRRIIQVPTYIDPNF